MTDILDEMFEETNDLIASDNREGRTTLLDVYDLKVGPWQPRRYFNPRSLRSLADSIAGGTQLDPISVWLDPQNNETFLVAGERRMRATKLLVEEDGKDIYRQIPARFLPDTLTKDQIWQLATDSNDERDPIDPFDRAEHTIQMMTELELTQEEAGKRLGNRSQTYVSRLLKVRELPEEIKNEFRELEGSVSDSFLFLTTRLDNEEDRLSFWNEIKQPDVSFHKAQTILKETSTKKKKTQPTVNKTRIKDRFLKDMQSVASRAKQLSDEGIKLSEEEVASLDSAWEVLDTFRDTLDSI